jgi:hypothetical protein
MFLLILRMVQGLSCCDYVTPTTSEETAALLAGRPPGITVQFNKYIFDEEASQLLLAGRENEDDQKENSVLLRAAGQLPASQSCRSAVRSEQKGLASCRPATDFLREVEKIFLGDIAGTGDLVPSAAVLSDITPR